LSVSANASACTAHNTTNTCATLHVALNEIISAPALYTTAAATYVTTRGACPGGDLATLMVVPGAPPRLTAA
jgi:hypothetical protein